MDFWTFLLQVLVLLAAAMVLGAIMERLRQSAMVGYLLAGAIFGPDAVNVVPEYDRVSEIAQLGVALLMFSIGLEFSLDKLRRLGTQTLIAGTLQIVGTIALTCVIAMALGQTFRAGIAIGAIVAMSSTAVVLPMLAARGQVDSVHGRFALGILLLQDLAVVPALLVVASLVAGGSMGGVVFETGKSFLIVGGYVVAFALFNRFVLPYIVAFGAAARNRELPILFAVVVAAGSAYLANSLGFSAALGAFIAGIFLGESVIATQVRGDVSPLKTVFAVLFFASIGMYLDPVKLAENWDVVLVTLLTVVLLKPLLIYVIAKLVGLSHRYAIAAGVCMGQIGVFSFVLAQVALADGENGIISETTFDLLINVTIISLFLTPTLTRIALPFGGYVERQLRRLGWADEDTGNNRPSSTAITDHVIIIGFGPAGRAVADALREHDHPFIVIDLNPRTVLKARAAGLPAYVGDAATSDVLRLAQVQSAKAVVITVPDHLAAIATIHRIRGECKAKLIVRARYQRYAGALQRAGAHVVVNEEAHVGESLGIAVNEAL